MEGGLTVEPPSILVIDDEVGMREGCRRALMSRSYRVETAEHGAEGLHKLREMQFDLVLVDAHSEFSCRNFISGVSGSLSLPCFKLSVEILFV